MSYLIELADSYKSKFLIYYIDFNMTLFDSSLIFDLTSIMADCKPCKISSDENFIIYAYYFNSSRVPLLCSISIVFGSYYNDIGSS